MELLIVAALLGLIPASIASTKGRSFGTWWFFGAMLFIVALPMALMMKPEGPEEDYGDEGAAPKRRSKKKAKARPDNHVPGWLVLVVIVGVGYWIYIEANSGGSSSRASSGFSSQPVAVMSESVAGPRNNAVRSAKQYLSMQGFSRNGLIQQLSSDYGDSYSVADATAAVDSLNINWNNQAVRSAKQYLSMQGFSCKGLIEQLSSSTGDQYTVSQATYGARQAGAC